MLSNCVVAIDPAGDRTTSVTSRGEAVAMHELALHRRPQTLGDGVIVARSRASDRLENAVDVAERSKIVGHVLTAAVVMKDHLVDVTAATLDRHRECSTHQLGAHVVVHVVANDAPRPEVEHTGEVEPPFVGSDVGDVPAGAPSRLTDREVTSDSIRQWRRPQVRNGRAHLLAPCVGGEESVGGDQSFDALVVGAESSLRQLIDEPRAAVGIIEVVVDGVDLVDQVGLVEVALARSLVSRAPLVVTRR